MNITEINEEIRIEDFLASEGFYPDKTKKAGKDLYWLVGCMKKKRGRAARLPQRMMAMRACRRLTSHERLQQITREWLDW